MPPSSGMSGMKSAAPRRGVKNRFLAFFVDRIGWVRKLLIFFSIAQTTLTLLLLLYTIYVPKRNENSILFCQDIVLAFFGLSSLDSQSRLLILGILQLFEVVWYLVALGVYGEKVHNALFMVGLILEIVVLFFSSLTAFGLKYLQHVAARTGAGDTDREPLLAASEEGRTGPSGAITAGFSRYGRLLRHFKNYRDAILMLVLAEAAVVAIWLVAVMTKCNEDGFLWPFLGANMGVLVVSFGGLLFMRNVRWASIVRPTRPPRVAPCPSLYKAGMLPPYSGEGACFPIICEIARAYTHTQKQISRLWDVGDHILKHTQEREELGLRLEIGEDLKADRSVVRESGCWMLLQDDGWASKQSRMMVETCFDRATHPLVAREFSEVISECFLDSGAPFSDMVHSLHEPATLILAMGKPRCGRRCLGSAAPSIVPCLDIAYTFLSTKNGFQQRKADANIGGLITDVLAVLEVARDGAVARPAARLSDFEWHIAPDELLLKDFIAKGASGKVYRGEYRKGEVAIKRMAVRREADLLEVIGEAAILSKLRHRSIVRPPTTKRPLPAGICLGVSARAGLASRPMQSIACGPDVEYMSRGSLYEILHNERITLPWPKRLEFALATVPLPPPSTSPPRTAVRSVLMEFFPWVVMLLVVGGGTAKQAQALNYLHANRPPILHRGPQDAQPPDWNVKVADFGLSRLKSEGQMTATVGTPWWIAPEVVIAGQGSYTERADVYSFGIILWELLTRLPPYHQVPLDPIQIAMKVSTEGFRPAVPPGCPQQYETLMRECWAQDPRLRPSFDVIVERLRLLHEHCGEIFVTARRATAPRPVGDAAPPVQALHANPLREF
ncbi:putative protein tyrosine kinase [Paratrimastix pyriformis]|uniref:Protein kinase domain-containing protein n=1 Tax=Paratrimastix pyriformis TaxID=342808 RepID=A0ABQ8UDG5_9EUKA|nr:putative protein tyrosine kinase [Paratrimastix pyriformis]